MGENLSTIEKAGELSKIDGPYVPLMRRGDHVVKGTVKVPTPMGARRISENEFEFKTDKEATDYAKANDLRTTVKKVWVDKATGETTEIDPATNKERKILASDTDSVPVYRAEVQNQHVEFVEGIRKAEARAKELAQDPNMEVHKVVPRAYEPSGRLATDLSHRWVTSSRSSNIAKLTSKPRPRNRQRCAMPWRKPRSPRTAQRGYRPVHFPGERARATRKT